MKIGIMLRHMSEHRGGVMVYTHNLMRQFSQMGTDHEFVLMYRDPSLIGTYSSPHLREIAARSYHQILWDQFTVKKFELQEKFDVIFNPKYSVPFLAKCPSVFVCHGLDWYVMPWGSKWADRMNHKYLIPNYTKKASRIIAVSNTARNHAIEYLGVDEDRISTIYLGVEEQFLQPINQARLEKIRKEYQLPDKYFLYTGQIYPPKNFGRLLRAYAEVGPRLGIPLVIAGEHRWLCSDELSLIDTLGISNSIIQTGWIDRDTLPALYQLAHVLLLPSLYEACPSPILEAMATGCPIVTSNRYGTAELAGNAAVLIDPEDVESIIHGMEIAATDENLRNKLRHTGFDRIKEFSWETCANKTIYQLELAADSL